ncbi:MAG TPA: polysaccharide biosynthesis tyrosine autokinase [Candidatus Binataceae bacterium]
MTQPSPYFIRRNQEVVAEPFDSSMRRNFNDEEEHSLDLLRYWITLRKHRWLILSITAAFMVIVAIRVSLAVPMYTAQSTLLLRSDTPQLLENHSQANNQSYEYSDGSDFVKTQVEIMRSRTLAAHVVQDEGLANDPAFTGKTSKPREHGTLTSAFRHWLAGSFGLKPAKPVPAARQPDPIAGLVGAYLGSFQIKPIQDTDMVNIIFTTTNPQLSARLANAHAHAYIREGIELHTQANAEGERFLREKLVELREKLEKSELALNNYRRDKGIVPGLMSMDGKETVVIDRLSDLSKQLTNAQVARIGLEAEVEQIHKHQFTAVPQETGSTSTGGLAGQLATAMSDYAAMSKQFKPDYPPLAQLKARIDRLQQTDNETVEKYAQSVEASYGAAKIKEAGLQEELNRVRGEALGLNDASVEYAILQREVDTNRELYNSVLQRMKDVGLAAESQTSNTVVVDDAVAPGGPSSPHPLTAILQAMAFGLALAIGLAFFIDYQDKTLKTPDEIEAYLRLPNLASVPSFARVEAKQYGNARINGNGTANLPAKNLEIAGSLSRYSVIGEAYRGLRTALMLSRAGSPPKSILITSSSNSEGKTVSAINTGVVFAHTGAKVLIIDCDLRRPRCHKVLGIENRQGLTEVLAGTSKVDQLIRDTGIEGLWLLTAGSIPPNPSELVGSERMRETLASLVVEFDLVIVDSPPLMPVTDAMLLSTMVDGVVLVVNSKKTAKQLARAALARLEFARAKLFGVLLNEVDVNSPHYRYYSSYHGGYGSYHPYTSDPADQADPDQDLAAEEPKLNT